MKIGAHVCPHCFGIGETVFRTGIGIPKTSDIGNTSTPLIGKDAIIVGDIIRTVFGTIAVNQLFADVITGAVFDTGI